MPHQQTASMRALNLGQNIAVSAHKPAVLKALRVYLKSEGVLHEAQAKCSTPKVLHSSLWQEGQTGCPTLHTKCGVFHNPTLPSAQHRIVLPETEPFCRVVHINH